MWNALKSDFLDFVSTIQEDTTKTLSKVLGEEEVDAGAVEETLLVKWIADTKRSYETYANPLRENKAKEFERFQRRFTLTGHAKEIAEVLDDEPEVSRFYAELVPTQISPEEFWARLFFRLQLLNRTGKINFEEDDEEEHLVWEDEEEEKSEKKDDREASVTAAPDSALLAEIALLRQQLLESDAEKLQLRQQVALLTQKVAQLELQLQQSQEQVPPLSRTSTVSPAQPPPPPIATDTVSVESSESSSGLLINHSDAASSVYFSEEETSRHGQTVVVSAPASASRTPSSVTAKILAAALDDEDEEESGWN